MQTYTSSNGLIMVKGFHFDWATDYIDNEKLYVTMGTFIQSFEAIWMPSKNELIIRAIASKSNNIIRFKVDNMLQAETLVMAFVEGNEFEIMPLYKKENDLSMTPEDYIEKEEQVEFARKGVYDVWRKIDKAFEATSPVKVGDKVLVYKERVENPIECFVAKVYHESFLGKVKLRYQFNKVKKDGTMSGQSAGIGTLVRNIVKIS